MKTNFRKVASLLLMPIAICTMLLPCHAYGPKDCIVDPPGLFSASTTFAGCGNHPYVGDPCTETARTLDSHCVPTSYLYYWHHCCSNTGTGPTQYRSGTCRTGSASGLTTICVIPPGTAWLAGANGPNIECMPC